ncbi:hypothetical protein INR49_019181 [Caranx melampygus]|nr:hypothetical protein INR49_019181 [Caranx melampygus]
MELGLDGQQTAQRGSPSDQSLPAHSRAEAPSESQEENRNFTNTDSHINTSDYYTHTNMSEDQPAETVETTPAEVNAIPNGKGHEPGEEITASAKTPPADDGDK